jgi:hypothetical protein
LTDPANPLAPDRPETDNILRAVFVHGYQRAMCDASSIVEQYSKQTGGRLALEIRTSLVEAGLEGGAVYDAIMRMNTPTSEVRSE